MLNHNRQPQVSNISTLASTLKPNYKSTPVIKNANLNLNEETRISKENFNSTKVKDNKISSELQDKNLSPGIKSGSKTNQKTAKVNLWRKPFNNQVTSVTPGQSPGQNNETKIKAVKSKTAPNVSNNINTSSSRPATMSNIMTTNYTENNKEQSPYKQLETLHDRYPMTGSNEIQSDILSSILNFKSLLRPADGERVFKSEADIQRINQLNSLLNNVQMGNSGLNDSKNSKNMITGEGIIKRETFIENTKKEKIIHCDLKYNNVNINIINSNMLSSDISLSNNNLKGSFENKENGKKDQIFTEIYQNSDKRIKRYEILLDFINSNLKEMNEIMQNSMTLNNDKDSSKQLYKIEEVNSNRPSSLHSKINLNSRTNIERDNLYDYEDSEMQENVNILPPNGKIIDETLFTRKEIYSKHRREYSQSLLISSIDSEYYQNLIEQSFNNNILNISNDMSSIRTLHDPRKYNISYDSEQTPVQYTRPTRGEAPTYNEGEENVDSDLDKTKENIQMFDHM